MRTDWKNIGREISFGKAKDVAARIGMKAGGAAKFSALLSKAQPYLIGAQIAYGFYARSRARSKAKADARESTSVKLKDVQAVEANQTFKVVYGLCGTKGVRTYIAVNEGETIPLEPSGVAQIGTIPFDPDQRRVREGHINCNRHEFYLAQYVLSIGDIVGVLGMQVDGRKMEKRWNNGGLLNSQSNGTLAGCWKLPYQTASSFAKSFARGERTDDSKYVGLSYADHWAQLPDSKNSVYRVFNGETEPLFFTRGRKVRELTKPAGEDAKTVADDKGTDNTACVLLDYITSGLYGPGLAVSSVDLESFHAFREQCDKALLDTTAPQSEKADGQLRNTTLPANCLDDPRTRELWNGGDPAIRRMILNECVADSDFDTPGSIKVLKQSIDKIRLGAFNGEIDSSAKFQDAIEEIIQCTPGCVVAFFPPDVVKVSLPKWDESAADQSVFTLTDDHLTEPVQVTSRDPEGRYNTYTCTFNNVDENFATKSVTWTDPDLVAEDGGEIREYEERLSGCVMEAQARTVARSRCLESRRDVCKGTYSMDAVGGVLDVNSVFRIQSDDYGVDDYWRMDGFTFDMETRSISFEAVEFVPTDYGPVLAARHTEFELVEEPLSTGAFVRLSGVPKIAVPAGTVIPIAAEVVGTTLAPVWTYEGAATTATADGVDWTPTASNGRLTATATLTGPMGPCKLTAVADVSVATRTTEPKVEVVLRKGRKAKAYWNGFTAAPTWNWDLQPSPAGTLSAKNTREVSITGGTDGVRGDLRVEATHGTTTEKDLVLLPWNPLEVDHGGPNAKDGEEKVL